MSIAEILIPRRFHPRETPVLSMLLRRGEISRDLKSQAVRDLSSKTGKLLTNMCNISLKIVLPGCRKTVANNPHLQNGTKSNLENYRWMHNILHRGQAFQSNQNGNINLEKQNYIIWPTTHFCLKSSAGLWSCLKTSFKIFKRKYLACIIHIFKRFWWHL